MDRKEFSKKLTRLRARYEELVTRPNRVDEEWYNGCFERYVHPVLTNEHVPLEWRYDLNPETNPYLMERLGVNAVFNAGAIELDGRICLVCRVEGNDRKSFFAVAESENGIDNFRFRRYPILIPQTEDKDINVYDMRLVKHEDGYIYGLFCTERKDPSAVKGDTSSAVAACGIVRTHDLEHWERLPDLKTPSPSSGTWFCIRNSFRANTPSTPARRTASSRRVPAAESDGDWPIPSKTPYSPRNRSWTKSSTTRSRK